MRLLLIPKSYRRNVTSLCQISSVSSPTEVLNSYVQIFFKTYRISNMPPVHTETLVGAISTVGSDYLVQSCIRSREFYVLSSAVEIIRTAEIILGTCTADGRELLIAIHEELDFAFTPPSVVVHLPCHIGTYIVPLPLDSVYNGVDILVRHRIGTAELCVEIAGILRNFRQALINLIIKPHRGICQVLHRYFTFLAERHLPIAVERTSRIYAYSQ